MNASAKSGQATIREVAELAGVSQMTVSRVINDRGMVKPSTRERVENAIGVLNYKPNFIARRLAGGEVFFIGILYSNPSPSYLSKILKGALRGSRKSGLHLVLDDMYTDEGLPKSPAKTAKDLLKAGLDGVILIPPISDDEELLKELDALSIQTVRIASMTDDPESLSVAIDDTEAVRAMTHYLADKGHEKIAFIKGPEDHPSTKHRFKGFKAGLEDKGLAFRDEYIQPGEYTYASGRQAALALIDLPDRPTAIFASNDDMAAGAIAAANLKRLVVPDDLSIVGFDDTELATSVWPGLTTIRQPIALMAERAVDVLAQTLKNQGKDRPSNPHMLLPHTLIERGSVR